MKRQVLAICAVLSLFAVAAPTASARTTYIVPFLAPADANEVPAKVTPRHFTLFTGAWLDGLRWKAWGRSAARAKGVASVTDKRSTPYRTRRARVKVTASKPTECGGGRFYRRLTIRFVKSVPPGQGLRRTQTYPLQCHTH